MSVYDKLPIPTTVFPIAMNVNSFKDPFTAGFIVLAPFTGWLRLGVSGLRATRDRVVQVTNGKDTSRVHTSWLPDKCPFHHARRLKISSLVMGFSAFPLRKEKKRKGEKKITGQHDSTWPVTANISVCEWGGAGERCSWRDFSRDTTVLGSHPKIVSN